MDGTQLLQRVRVTVVGRREPEAVDDRARPRVDESDELAEALARGGVEESLFGDALARAAKGPLRERHVVGLRRCLHQEAAGVPEMPIRLDATTCRSLGCWRRQRFENGGGELTTDASQEVSEARRPHLAGYLKETVVG